jgi:hypothetical protein
MMYESRDHRIVKFINEFGFCELPQIQKQFGLSRHRAYKVMQRLMERGYIRHERVFFHRHGIYRATRAGAQQSGLPMLSKIPIGIYEHQLAVIEVYIKLMKEYPGATWLTERVLRKTGFMPGRNRRRDKHYADALMFLPDGKQIAIEVELTMKSKRRLDKILLQYMTQFEIKEVWYFCAADVADKVKRLADAYKSVIKVFEFSPDKADKTTSVDFVG